MLPKFNNANPSIEAIATQEQIDFILSLPLPKRLILPTSSEFDTQSIDPSQDVWEFNYGGYAVRLNLTSDHHFITHLMKVITVNHCQSLAAPTKIDSFEGVKRCVSRLKLDHSSYFSFLEKMSASDDHFSYRMYFEIKRVMRYFFRINMPLFDMNHYDLIDEILPPNASSSFLKYQDIENAFPSHLKRLISKGLTEHSTSEGLSALSDKETEDLAVLGLAYATGMRPIQFSKLKRSSIKREAENPRTHLIRYKVSVPLAKQRKTASFTTDIAVPDCVGLLVEEYAKRFVVLGEEQLFPMKSQQLKATLNSSLNRALLFIHSDETKQAIKNGETIQPRLSLSDFRHNVGHSLAMNGVSAEEIAYILGHSSTLVASHYIMATPELAMIQHKALGVNPVWQNMIGLMLTGYASDIEDWKGHTVSGMLQGKLFVRIGGCSRKQTECHLTKVRSCYGCFYFRPFKDLKPHKEILKIFTDELFDLIEISNKTGSDRNPMIKTATDAKHEVELVINRLSRGLL